MANAVLVSEEAARALRARNAQVELVIASEDAPMAAQALRSVGFAFLSTDIVWGTVLPEPRMHMEAFFDHLRRAPHLQWLHVCSAGANRPVFAELMARGVRLTTSSGANAAEVSQTALAGFLALARHVPEWVDAQRRHAWEPISRGGVPVDIVGQTAVVVGTGAIGREIARLLQAFGLGVIGVNRSGSDVLECAEVLPFGRIDDALRRADWLVLACPLTPETRGLVDRRRLRAMPRGSHIINVARGEILVEPDLIGALQEGHLAGAYLDVTQTEPLPAASLLWDLPGVLISPHSAGFSTGVAGRTVDMFLANLARWHAGTALLNEVAAFATPA